MDPNSNKTIGAILEQLYISAIDATTQVMTAPGFSETDIFNELTNIQQDIFLLVRKYRL